MFLISVALAIQIDRLAIINYLGLNRVMKI